MSELPRAINFLTKPPYEAGDKPQFDRGPGKRLPATWQGGNLADPNPGVKHRAKSYEELSDAAERPPRFSRQYPFRWDPHVTSYGDRRSHGKIPAPRQLWLIAEVNLGGGRPTDFAELYAAHLGRESLLHRAIDLVRLERRQQIKRQRSTRLWAQERCQHQPRRLLYLLKQPRTWLEASILLYCVRWFLTQRVSCGPFASDLSTAKEINCVSDLAMLRSKENDGRTLKPRRHVFPSKSEEADLASRARDGDTIARDRILNVHWPLVHSIARKHAGSIEDLTQEGFVGLIRALEKFDSEMGFRFAKFAGPSVEWAIQDYKRRNGLDTGTISRTSRIIADSTGRMTGHISPYESGLAPETHDFIAELNAEAIESGTSVKYTGLANKIEATGDIHGAANLPNLGGWFLRRALKNGYSESEARVLRRGNSHHRKKLRKIAKRKSPDTFRRSHVYPYRND